jgi:NAD(P)H-dependent FMN reductase
MADPISIVLIYGSVRPGRFCDRVVAWASARIRRDPRFDLDVLDPATLALTGADSAAPALAAVKAQLDRAEAFVIVTPEYNHSFPGALKLLIDAFSAEWQAKPVAFVSYGGVSGGLRAVEHLRHVFAELHAVTMRDGVSLTNPWSRLADPADAPDGADQALSVLLGRLAWWAQSLRAARHSSAYADAVA